jgi:hypothetical protein
MLETTHSSVTFYGIGLQTRMVYLHVLTIYDYDAKIWAN